MAASDDWQLGAAPLAASLQMYPQRDRRVGMRSGMNDAAVLCDLIAGQILQSGRKSRRRSELAAVAKRCGDAIDAMRDQVDVPR